MELWIRSTAKTNLLQARFLTIMEGKTFYKKNEWEYEGYTICNVALNGNYEILGTYKTKERAIEVLDEIQNILKPKIVIKFDNKPKYLEDGTINDVLTPREEIDYSKQLSTYVYEMPEK